MTGLGSREPGRVWLKRTWHGWVQENLAGLGSREPGRVRFKRT